MHEKFQYYNGVKFTRDEKTGYYLNSTLRIRMHRYVWVCEKGDIPEGYDVHHIDHDKSNNDISNLELLTKSEHKKKHFEEMPEEKQQWFRDNMNNKARPAAIEWHKSDAGKDWHAEHMKTMIEKGQINKKQTYICEQCGKEFEVVKRKGHKFCSGACEQKYRRDNHLNDAEFVCKICGKTFISDKYGKPSCCSPHCRNVLRGITIRESKGN